MSTKKAGKPAVKAAAKPVAKAGAKALQKKPIDLKSQEKPAAKPAAAKPAAPPAKPAAPPAKLAAPPAKPAAAPAKPAAPPAKPAAPSARPAAAPPPSAAPAKVKRPTNGAVKVGVVGCAGRMGQMLLKMLISAPGIVVVGGSERKGSVALGQDLGALAGTDPLGISVSDDPSVLFETADVVVDFTNPTATVSHAQMAARTGCALVIGTTGFDTDQLQALYRAAQRAPIVLAANMSLGINLLQQVVEEVARILDPDWDIEIIEMHHRQKIDAPSGTALALGEAAARGRGQQLRRISRRSRDGQVGPRVKGEIGFAALRGGDVVGDHTVIFAADGERVEITHRASSREIFARGAVKSVLWAAGKRPGLYSMRDVLGFSVQGPQAASSTPAAGS
jgi:4-hydroxy-tetrahydrodipicolinate reductase